MERCGFTHGPCQQSITTKDGTGTTWHHICQLSAFESGGHPIDTTKSASHSVFQTKTPRGIAEVFSKVRSWLFVKHSCEQCTAKIRHVLRELRMTEAE